MKHIFNRLGVGLLTALVLTGITFPVSASTSVIPQTAAFFETYLTAPITSSATSFTIASNSVSGISIANGFYGFILDQGTASQEVVECTLTGTAASGCTRGIQPQNPNATSSVLMKAHGRAADVKITDYPFIGHIGRILTGTDTIPAPIAYDSTVSTSTIQSSAKNLVDVSTLQGVVAAGSVNASASQNGISQLATATQCRAGTATGSTGALLICPNSLFNSTQSATTIVPVTGTNGKLAQGFQDLTAGWTYSGGLTSSATTTLSGPIVISSTSALPVVRTYIGNATSSATSTWTKPPNLRYAILKVQAGGGSSGGANGDSEASGGGGGGGYCQRTVAAASFSSTETVTAGGGANAGTVSGAGVTGGNSSFGSLCTANGGAGGAVAATTGQDSNGGAGGTAASGDVNITGGNGSYGIGGLTATRAIGGYGGSSQLGRGGASSGDRGGATNPNPGTGYGSGGGGVGDEGGADDNGSNGQPGIVIVEEYYI